MKRSTTILLVLALVAALGAFALAQDKKAPANVQTAKVTVDAKGFTPGSLDLKANTPAKITFTRTSNDTCATEVVFPDYKINKPLPLNKAVDVEFTPSKSGTFAFACGMNMFKGKVVVK
jgi:plastocyanin domain-containing protein